MKKYSLYFSNDSTSLATFSSLSKKAPNSSESTSGMAPALAAGAAAASAGVSSAAEPDNADLILNRIKRPKYPPAMATTTVRFFDFSWERERGGGREERWGE